MPLYESAPFFFLRQSQISQETFDEVLSSSNRIEALLDYYKNSPEFRLAIAVASPDLHEALKTQKLSTKDRKKEQHHSSILKYFLRSVSRTTPFGLFASISYGEFVDKPQLSLETGNAIRKIRPDMTWISHLINEDIQEIELGQRFKVISNPGILSKGKNFYLIQQFSDQEDKSLLTISASSYAKHILEMCSQPIHFCKLIDKLSEKYGTEKKVEITESVIHLLKKNFLISELIPSLRENNFLGKFLEKVKDVPEMEKATSKLRHFQSLSKRFEAGKDNQAIGSLEKIYATLGLSKKLPYPTQVDTARLGTTFLPTNLAKEIEILPELLLAFQNNQSETLKKFHEEFLELFGVNVLVPVKEALKHLDYQPAEDKKILESHSPLEPLFFESSKSKIILSESFVQKCISKVDPTKVPFSSEIFFELLSHSPEEFSKGNYTIMLNPHLVTNQVGSSLGRFLYLLEDKAHQKLRAFAKKEEMLDPDVQFVETGFLPISPRTANVAFFKPIRDYYLGFEYHENNSASLYLDDICLGANLDEMYLFSKKLRKKLHLSLGTLVNENLAPPTLRLLLDISHFGRFKIYPAPWLQTMQAPYLPELRYKNIVLSPQRWLINKENTGLRKSKNQKKDLQKYFGSKKIPHEVLLCIYDHRLRLNWKIPEHFEIIYQQFCLKNEIVLLESLHRMLGVPFGNSSKHFHTEIAALFKLREAKKIRTQEGFYEVYRKSKKRFLDFSSDCLYAKIYLPSDQIEQFLLNSFVPLVNELTKKKVLSHWFFIRYADSKPHIRLRFFKKNRVHRSVLFENFAQVSERWLKNQVISDLSLNIYNRELERYGGENCIEAVEQFFCADSVLTIQILQRADRKESYPRFVLASIGIVLILNGFFKKSALCLEFLTQIGIDQSVLSGVRPFTKKIVNYLSHLLTKNNMFIDGEPLLMSLTPIFHDLQNYAEALSQGMKKKELSGERTLRLIDSLIHMHCNRLLGMDHELEKKARGFAGLIIKKIVYLESKCLK